MLNAINCKGLFRDTHARKLSQRIRCAEISTSLSGGSGLSCLLGEEVSCLANTSLEQIVILHDELNIVNWQIDEHTSNLGSFRADNLVNVFVENGTNLILVVRVLWNNSWEDRIGGHDVPLINRQRLSSILHWLLSHLSHLLLLLLKLLHLHHLCLAVLVHLLTTHLLAIHLVWHSHLLSVLSLVLTWWLLL